ncbi:hypothetical protein ACFOE1_15550 [Agromyces mediolanus]|uniref:Uncharacterized protein n=1 Tax=Agromyces mediolanus TaxID=41986 RepID=A0A918CFT4_AGRME|nr:hypothetical protein [Agromyces mediolanus]GGR23012.1 hypothetical protein GCM10010196_15970 [Agromyces mediolanus]GLJ71146.1 hypothetical protein GCM10017583_04010 [Agromyces mediolanus]
MTDASAPAEQPETSSEPRTDVAGADAAEASARPATPLWLAVVIAAVTGLFYAYDVWEAVGNLVGLNLYADSLGVGLTAYGVVVLIIGVVLPFLVYAIAFWVGRRRGPLGQLALFVVGYALVQVLSADVAVLFGLNGLDLG